MRPMPIALRTAYSCCRCSPRTSSRAAAFPQAINSTSAAAPKQRQQDAAAVAIQFAGQRLHSAGAMPSKVVLGLRLSCGNDRELPLRPLEGVPSIAIAPPRSQSGRFSPLRVGSTRNPEIHQRVDVVVRLFARAQATGENGLRAASRRSPSGGASERLMRTVFPMMCGSPLNFRCQNSYPENDDPHRSLPVSRFHESAPQHGLQSQSRGNNLW